MAKSKYVGKKYDKRQFIEVLEKFIDGEYDIKDCARELNVTVPTITKRFNEFLSKDENGNWNDMEKYWK